MLMGIEYIYIFFTITLAISLFWVASNAAYHRLILFSLTVIGFGYLLNALEVMSSIMDIEVKNVKGSTVTDIGIWILTLGLYLKK